MLLHLCFLTRYHSLIKGLTHNTTGQQKLQSTFKKFAVAITQLLPHSEVGIYFFQSHYISFILCNALHLLCNSWSHYFIIPHPSAHNMYSCLDNRCTHNHVLVGSEVYLYSDKSVNRKSKYSI